MDFLLALSRGVDRITTVIGKSVSWLVLVAVLVSAINATVRFVFDRSSNGWLELQWYLFGAVFLVCAAYTLLNNEHIRIDIVSGRLSKKSQHMIDVIGHVFFLLPLCAIMLYELLTCRQPYAHLPDVAQRTLGDFKAAVALGKEPPAVEAELEGLAPAVRSLLKAMWAHEPSERLPDMVAVAAEVARIGGLRAVEVSPSVPGGHTAGR